MLTRMRDLVLSIIDTITESLGEVDYTLVEVSDAE